jgi:pyruvate dehydrogenase E2 component (dihydrolipoamide acetyltransferase)
MAAPKEARVPDIGGYDDVPVIEVLVAEGDTVAQDQGLVTLESDKATMEVPAPFAGVVRELKLKVGDTVSEGSVVALIEPEGASGDGEAKKDDKAVSTGGSGKSGAKEKDGAKPMAQDQAEAKAGQDQPPAKPAKAESTGSGKAAAPAPPPAREDPAREQADDGPRTPPVAFDSDAVLPDRVPYASPAVRLYARELGVDLSRVEGSARGGRITREDVQQFVKGVLAGSAAGAGARAGGGLDLLPWPKVDFAKYGEVEVVELSRIQKIAGANLARNWAMIPHVTQHEDADITGLEALRVALNKENARAIEKGKATKLTMLAFLMKAVAGALQEFPRFNASLDDSGERLVLKKYVHIGFAADTPNGLVVPVVRDCDRKGVMQIAAESAELAAKARDGKLGPAQMQGGCFSISSLGGIGGTKFTPIVNAPEVAILGVSRADTRPVWDGKAFKPRLILPLSLSYDHRVIDGAAAARFSVHLAAILADMRRALL